MSPYRALARADLRNIARDPLLLWIGALPFFLALFFRLAPLLRDILLARFAFDLATYYPLIASAFLTSAPGIAGMVVGFLLLDERDDGVLMAIAVTPLHPAAYLAYRVAAPLLVGFATTVVAYPLLGFVALPAGDLVAVAAVAAMTAPVTALFLAIFAENKVSGFAVVKILNVVGIAPVAAWFVDEPLQWLAGIVPSYWPMKMLWLAADGRPYGSYALTGVAVTCVVLALLSRIFRRRMAA